MELRRRNLLVSYVRKQELSSKINIELDKHSQPYQLLRRTIAKKVIKLD